MGKMSDIMKAMSLVPDERIDPNTGQVTHKSGKSVLEKTGIKLNEDTKISIEEIKLSQKETKKDCGDAVRAYREMMGMPINENSPSNKGSQYIEVGHIPNDEEFIKMIAKKIKK